MRLGGVYWSERPARLQAWSGRRTAQAEESALSQMDREYERLIAPIEDQMMRSIWRVTQNGDDAEEAFQQALTAIWRRWDKICAHPNPQALILRICLNASRDALRRRVRRERRERKGEVHGAKPRTTPAEELSSRERESAIFRALGQLSRNQSAAVTLRLVQGESYSRIAGVLGCGDATARKHVARGRERLRQILAPLVPHFNGDNA